MAWDSSAHYHLNFSFHYSTYRSYSRVEVRNCTWCGQASGTLLVDIEAMDNQGLAVTRYLGDRSGRHAASHLHAQVLVQGHEGQES